jgi:hypothetical protein
MGEASKAGGIVLPPEVEASIAAAQAAVAKAPPPAPPSVYPHRLAGGVSAMPIDESTNLQINIPACSGYAGAVTNVNLSVTARILNPDGTLTYCEWDQVFPLNGGLTALVALAPGYLVGLTITCNNGVVSDGVLFCVAGLIHRPQPGAPLDTLLIAHYVSYWAPAGWPMSIVGHISDTRGFPFVANQRAPGAGSYAQYTCVDQYLEVISAQATLTTDAVAGNRQVYGMVTPYGGGQSSVTISNAIQAASTSVAYTFAVGLQIEDAAGGAQQLMPLPAGLVVASGGQIRLYAAGMDAGDQWSNLVILGRAWA